MKKSRMRFTEFDEYDFPRPMTTFGMNALHGEQYIQRYTRKYAIIRPGYLFDPTEMKTADPKKLIPLGNPMITATLNSDFAKAILEIIDKEVCGMYNVANQSVGMTLLELIQKYRTVKYDLIQPKQGQQYCHNQMITGHKLKDRTGFVMPELTWKSPSTMKIVN